MSDLIAEFEEQAPWERYPWCCVWCRGYCTMHRCMVCGCYECGDRKADGNELRCETCEAKLRCALCGDNAYGKCWKCLCIEPDCHAPHIANGFACAAHDKQHRKDELRGGLRFVHHMMRHPSFAAALVLRHSLLCMAVYLAASTSGPFAAVFAAVLATEVGGWLALQLLQGSADE